MIYARLPGSDRCKLCAAPMSGPGSILMRPFGFRPWERNPSICRVCISGLEKLGPGGAEITTSLMFADVRGSTGLAERLSPTEYSALIARLHRVASKAIFGAGGVVKDFTGDQVVGSFFPGISGPAHGADARSAARRLLVATGHDDPAGPWLRLGAAIHTGVVFVGTGGSAGSIDDFTVVGDAVNTAARLAGAAEAGEILLSESAALAAGIDTSLLRRRTLALRGKSQSIDAWVEPVTID
jgi:adenylate cyclase